MAAEIKYYWDSRGFANINVWVEQQDVDYDGMNISIYLVKSNVVEIVCNVNNDSDPMLRGAVV